MHIMIREGKRDVALEYLTHHARLLDCKHMATTGSRYSQSIIRYSRYLQERVKQFAVLKVDYVRNKKDGSKQGRLRTLPVDKGLLREVEGVQSQLSYLLQCKFHSSEVQEDITLTSFRLLVYDLLALHQAVNEGVINVLEHYFEMSRFDAERSLEIYNIFVGQMHGVVEYLQVARKLEASTKLLVPNIKHAPTSLTSSLEEYLNDPDFDVNRRQFLAQREAKLASGLPLSADIPANIPTSPTKPSTAGSQEISSKTKMSPEQQLIDFFSSIEKEESVFPSTSGENLLQNNGMPIQQQYLEQQKPIDKDYTGAGFGGYSAQPQQPAAIFTQGYYVQQQPEQIPEQGQMQSPSALQPQKTGTNPFRQSTVFSSIASTPTVSGTAGKNNPFTSNGPNYSNGYSNLGSVPEYTGMMTSSQGTPSAMAPVPLQISRTGTNPFARANTGNPGTALTGMNGGLAKQNTGNNPFRQSQAW